MHAFGIGYGVALAACLCASVVRWAMQSPAPIGPAAAAGMIAAQFATVTVFGWVLVYGSLLAPKNFDARAAFRAADPRGRKSFAAGLVSGLGAVGVAVLIHAVIQPSGQERDVNTIRAGILSFMSVGLGWLPGVILFLWWFRPRPPADPPPP